MSNKFIGETVAPPEKEEEPDYLFKIILIGDSGVGKTNFLSRFTRDQFLPESKTTIGLEFATKTIHIDKTVIKAQIWDTAGQERFRTVTSAYYRGADGALILYDICSSLTFRSISKWLDELRKNVDPENITVALIGNKSDQAQLRSIPQDDGVKFAQEQKLLFFEASAKDAINVNEAFTEIITQILNRKKANPSPKKQQSGTKLPKDGVPVEKSGCC